MLIRDRFFTQNTAKGITGEIGNAEVVRTFYTYRSSSKSDISVWYADVEFGFHEDLPRRVANLDATHVLVEVRNPNP